MTIEPADLTCRDVNEFLGAYFEGALDGAERARFDDHLAECPDCRTYLRQYEATIRLAKDACGDDGAVDADVPEQLVDAILAATGKPPRHRLS